MAQSLKLTFRETENRSFLSCQTLAKMLVFGAVSPREMLVAAFEFPSFRHSMETKKTTAAAKACAICNVPAPSSSKYGTPAPCRSCGPPAWNAFSKKSPRAPKTRTDRATLRTIQAPRTNRSDTALAVVIILAAPVTLTALDSGKPDGS
jgi:hypothetical protein